MHAAAWSRSFLRSTLLVLLAFGCVRKAPQAVPVEAAPPPEQAPEGRLPRDVKPLGYTLELEIVPSRDRFSGRTQIRVELAQPSARIWLHGRDLEVKSVRAQSAGGAIEGRYSQVTTEGVARVDFAQVLPAGQTVLELAYEAPFNRQLAGLYKVQSGGDDYAFTQFEPFSARLAFPCFDEPAFKTPFDVWLTVPSDHAAISNTPELAAETTPAGVKRVHFAATPPLPTYLVAFAVGPLDVVPAAAPMPPSAVRAQPLPLRGAAARGKGTQLRYVLEHTPPLIDELERYFAIAFPYPKLDLIAVPDFAAGAMENAGAITFREYYLLIDPETASESQIRAFTSVNAHEIAHHWFGDLVTMPWWDDIWLNEAFATWMAARTVAAVHPEHKSMLSLRASVLGVMDYDSRVSARSVRQPIASTHDIQNAFDGITYQKGAGVLAMFERYLGVEPFRAGIQAYLRAHANGTATAADLVAALNQASGKDVSAALSSFVDQPGVPWVKVELRCGERNRPAEVLLRQGRYLPVGSNGSRAQLWQIPMCMRYQVGKQTHENCTLFAQPEATVPLAAPGCPEWIAPNADGVGYYRWGVDKAMLEALRKNGWAKLTGGEKLSFADSVEAGFSSGALTADAALRTLPTLAADPERPVAIAPMELLEFTRDYLLGPDERPALDRYATRLYEARLKKLGWQERAQDDGDTKLLRADLIGFLAHVARDPAVRDKAAELGRRYLNLDGGAKPEAVTPDLRTLAVQVAVQEGDDAMFDAVYKRFTTMLDPVERDRLLAALVSVTDARSTRALALTLDPALRVNEVLVPLRYQVSDERTRAAAWNYLEQNFEAIVARVSETRAGNLPSLAAPFCSREMAARVQTFFAPQIERLRGGPRSLASAVEALTLCAAKAELQKASAKAFFAPER